MSQISIVLGLNASAAEVAQAIGLIQRAFAAAPEQLRAVAGATISNIAAPQTTATAAGGEDDDTTPAAGIPALAVNPDGTVKLDSTGLPWDGRIHSGTGKQTKENVWNKRKGVDDATVATVTAELRQKFPAAAITTPTVTAPAAAVTAPVAVSAPVVAVQAAPLTPYQEFCTFLARNTGAVMSQEIIDSTLTANNTSLAALATADAGTLDAFRTAFVTFLTQNGATVA